jgi:hypothetical protein
MFAEWNGTARGDTTQMHLWLQTGVRCRPPTRSEFLRPAAHRSGCTIAMVPFSPSRFVRTRRGVTAGVSPQAHRAGFEPCPQIRSMVRNPAFLRVFVSTVCNVGASAVSHKRRRYNLPNFGCPLKRSFPRSANRLVPGSLTVAKNRRVTKRRPLHRDAFRRAAETPGCKSR